MIESDYIERDKADLNADQLKVLKVLNSDWQPLTEISEKTGLDPNYVAFIMD